MRAIAVEIHQNVSNILLDDYRSKEDDGTGPPREDPGRAAGPSSPVNALHRSTAVLHDPINHIQGASNMIKEKLLAVFSPMAAVLAVSAAPAFAEFQSNSSSTSGVAKTGALV